MTATDGGADRGDETATADAAGGLLAATRRAVDLAARRAQRQWRTPGLSVGVVRHGRLVHSIHVGSARLDPPTQATDDTGWLIGSVTKMFTGVLVMQLRDQGRVGLDDPVRAHLPGVRAEVTIRQLLSHLSGLPRETAARMWEGLGAPDTSQLQSELEQVEQVLPAHSRFHYSNLAFAVLGLIVERLEDCSYEEALTTRVLGPLGMTQTGLQPPAQAAHGYHVHPWTGVARREPILDLRATAPMGGIWSTLSDLSRFSGFLAGAMGGAGESVLSRSTLDEMCHPHVLRDPDRWTMGHGLSFGLVRREERIFVGHGGAMPGFLTGLRVSRSEDAGVIAWANTTAHAAPVELAGEVLALVLDHEPIGPSTWRPEAQRPELTELLGSWWSEGEELVFTVRDGQLTSAIAEWGALGESRYELVEPGVFRVVDGRECGELLELTYDQAGRLQRMHLAGYAVTRAPLGFVDL